jgi:predicted Ser/Thr protein kinase
MSPEQLMTLLPQFDQIEFIGRGGMGVVYKARQKNLDRPVALKVLLPEVAGSPGFAERFAREARAMARLSHPNIVAVHDFGCVDNSGVELCYFSMEFVDGSNLRGLIKQLTPSQALAIVPQICEALQYAHDIGIIHRDIKPENILVDKKGRVKIADFGLAKLLQTARSPSDYTLTRPDLVMGTPSYMAPEQMERPTEVDHRADLYSLGVVFYEMLTGQLPKGRFPLPSQRVQIDVRFDEVVLKALEHDRELRYQHASEVQTSVEAVRGTPSQPPTTATLPPAAIPTPSAHDPPAVGKIELPAPPASPPRLSPTALTGALCGAAIMLAAPLAIVASQNIDPRYYFDKQTGIFHQGPTWAIVLMFVGWVLSGLSVAGMTLLGVVAVAQIRRTPEKLYGLRLALFDALLCPLLLLDLVIGVLGAYLFVPSSHAPQHLSLSTDVPPETGSVASTVLGVLIFALVGALLDPLIYWWVWKKLRVERPRRRDDQLATESLAPATAQPVQPSAIAPTKTQR